MNRSAWIWTVVMLVAGGFLAYRAATREHGMGKVYVKPAGAVAEGEAPKRWVETTPKDARGQLSIPRTIGLWMAAFFTLSVLSFLYRDNVCYRLSEAVFVGVSAGWTMVVGFWDGIVDKLLVPLAPGMMRAWMMPDIPSDREPSTLYLVPLLLGLMLLWRLVPRGGWIARWPLALVVGTFAGLKLVNFLDADFVSQIRSTIVPLLVFSREGFDPWASLRNVGLVLGTLASLTYFFFSVEHRGFVGRTARVGIWFLMITFGASFAFTVMGRIALLAARVTFILDDWLWLIDQTGKRPEGW